MSQLEATQIYALVREGLDRNFSTVLPTESVLSSEPSSAPEPPALYSLFEGFTREPAGGGMVTIVYKTLHRLLISWADPFGAEADLISYADSLPGCVEAHETLSTRIRITHAHLTSGTAGFTRIAGTEYRSCDFHSEVTVKAPLGAGI